MARPYVEDPLKIWRFQIEIDGFTRFGFQEATGLEMTNESVEYREGGMNSTVQKSVGQTSFANITLRRGQIIGMPGSNDMMNWISDVHEVGGRGVAANYRRDMEIVQYDAAGNEAARWSIINCFPVRYKPFSDLNALEKAGNSIEELEIAHEGFQRL